MSSANSGDTQRWDSITRPFAQEDVERLRGSVRIEYTLAKEGAERLWALLNSEPQVTALGALTGNQAVQQVRAGLQAIISAARKLRRMQTFPNRCIPTRASIRRKENTGFLSRKM
jgi:isocitrate lyase